MEVHLPTAPVVMLGSALIDLVRFIYRNDYAGKTPVDR